MPATNAPPQRPRLLRLTVPDGTTGGSHAPAAGVSLVGLAIGHQTGSVWIFWGALLALGFVLYRAGRSTVVAVDGAARALRVAERVWFRAVSERSVPFAEIEDVVVEEEHELVPDAECGQVLIRTLRISVRRRRGAPVPIALPSDLPRARAESFAVQVHDALHQAGLEGDVNVPRGAAYRQRVPSERGGR